MTVQVLKHNFINRLTKQSANFKNLQMFTRKHQYRKHSLITSQRILKNETEKLILT